MQILERWACPGATAACNPSTQFLCVRTTILVPDERMQTCMHAFCDVTVLSTVLNAAPGEGDVAEPDKGPDLVCGHAHEEAGEEDGR